MSVISVALVRKFTGSPISGTVPISRSINTTAPLAGGGNLSADRTLSIAVTPANPGGAIALQAASPGSQQTGNINISGQIVAGNTITGASLVSLGGISAAAPIVGDLTGDVTGNLTGDVTGNVSGYATGLKNLTGSVNVSLFPAPTTGQVLVAISATEAHWASVAGTGTVSSIATTAPVTGGPITTVGTIGLAVTPADDGGAVALQALFPGTPQGGSLNVVGVTAEKIVSGQQSMAVPAVQMFGPALSSAYLDDAISPIYQGQYARGNEGAPAAVQDGDVVNRFAGEGYQAAAFRDCARITLAVSGTPAGNFVPGAVKLEASDDATGLHTKVMVTDQGVHIGGNVTTGGNVPLDIEGAIATRISAFTLANGQNDDLGLDGSKAFLRINGPTAPFSITGFTEGFDGRHLKVYNPTGFQMSFKHQTGSAANNQIITLTGAETNAMSAEFVYDDGFGAWLLVYAQG